MIIALGCLIDSISIMLILLPIALPVARAAGFDLIWFGVLTVVAVEMGLFVLAMLVALVILILFPPIATWLARLY